MIKVKYTANIITASRIVCSAILLLLKPLSALFFSVYFICGLSDVLDGYIARKADSVTQFGATLDSVADFVFITVLMIIFIPFLPWPQWILHWIGAIALIRFISLAVGFKKYHTLTFLHTYANKATGLAMFCFPFLYSIWGLQLTAFLLCGFASLSSIEELTIMITSKELCRDIKCIFRI